MGESRKQYGKRAGIKNAKRATKGERVYQKEQAFYDEMKQSRGIQLTQEQSQTFYDQVMGQASCDLCTAIRLLCPPRSGFRLRIPSYDLDVQRARAKGETPPPFADYVTRRSHEYESAKQAILGGALDATWDNESKEYYLSPLTFMEWALGAGVDLCNEADAAFRAHASHGRVGETKTDRPAPSQYTAARVDICSGNLLQFTAYTRGQQDGVLTLGRPSANKATHQFWFIYLMAQKWPESVPLKDFMTSLYLDVVEVAVNVKEDSDQRNRKPLTTIAKRLGSLVNEVRNKLENAGINPEILPRSASPRRSGSAR